MNEKRLHLGCGEKYIPGFTHIDIQPYKHIDHVSVVSKLDMIEDSTVELIYACHVLEHFGRNEYYSVLKSGIKLQPKGILRLAVPDFKACIDYYLSMKEVDSITSILGLVCGGQRNKFDYHKMIFDEKSLAKSLTEIGFKQIYKWDLHQTEHSNIDDYFKVTCPIWTRKWNAYEP